MFPTVLEFFNWLLELEDEIRHYVCEGNTYYCNEFNGERIRLDLDCGSCDLLANACYELEDWEYYDYIDWVHTTFGSEYPVFAPTVEGATPRMQFQTSTGSYNSWRSKYMWGSGDYAQARWDFIRTVVDTLEKE